MGSQLIISQKKRKEFYGSEIKLLSPAKINLYLNIIGKYSKNYHCIESLAERISLFDKIFLKVSAGSDLNITCNYRYLESKENLAYRAAALMRKEFSLPFGFSINLEKNIPVGAGLGGGSSNAASVIIGIKELFSLDVSRERLYNVGKQLGSDVNFFLSGSSYAFLSGRGEKIEPLFISSRLKHFIIWPGIFLSTSDVYKNTKAKLTSFFSSVNMLKYSLIYSDYLLLKKSTYNCLEKSAFALSEKLARAKKRLNREGIDTFMSGSGSAFYTIGIKDCQRVKKVVPKGWFVRRAQTF